MGTGVSRHSKISADGALSLLDAATEALVAIDADGRIAVWNRAAQMIFGWSAQDVVGAEMAERLVAKVDRERYRAAMSRFGAGFAGRLAGGRIEIAVLHRSGREVPVELTLALIEDQDRPLVVVSLHDISERKDAEARQRRCETIVYSSGEAIVSASLDGTIDSWNPAAERLYGYSARDMLGASVALLSPAGRLNETDPDWRGVREGRSVARETRERCKNGALIDVAVTRSPLYDDAGLVTGVVSVVRDVSARNRDAKRLTESESRFADAFEAAPTGMALVAPDGRFLSVNPALCLLLGREPNTLLGLSFSAVTHPEDLAAGVEQVKRALAGEIDTYRQSKRYVLPNGGIVWGLLTFTIVRDADGLPKYFVAQIQDITGRKTTEGELDRYAAQLEALSGQDPLTGLPNRRAFEAAVAEELGVIRLGGATCSVLLAQADGDDAAVIAAAGSLTQASRDTDVVAHLGDGELAVLLPSVDDAAAAGIVERIRDATAHQPIRSSHTTAEPSDTVEALMRRVRAGIPVPRSGRSAHAARRGDGIARLLELARDQLGMPVAFLARLEGESYVFAHLAGANERFGVAQGDSVLLKDTFCQRMLDSRIGSTVGDLAAEPHTRNLKLTTRLGLGAYAGVPVRLRSGEIYGTLCTVDTRAHPELGTRHIQLLSFLSELVAELIEDETKQQAVRRVQASATGVRTLLVALEARDYYTGEHSKQVVGLAAGVARRLGLSIDASRDVEQVALLHDIGKVGIPDAILQKQGPLDKQEWQLMRQHPIVGEHIIAGTPGLSHLAPAMRAEHENWDGNGYPDGLAREQIPLASRITLACDAYNAMTSNRPYRPAMSPERAQQELKACAGRQFDPQAIQALLAEIAASPKPAAELPGPPSTTTAQQLAPA